MLEFLFLLLPIAAIYGYYMGSHKADKLEENKKVQQVNNFTKGINFFLHRDKERAVDEFIQFYNSKNERTFEESIALGNLFRERGEIDRAIKFHTSLISSTNIDPAHRSMILLELAKDFLKVGLLSKSEEILYELLSYNTEKKECAKMLIKIYQQEKDWKKAINVINTFKDVLGDSIKLSESEFYCELGNDAYSVQSYTKANELFSKALAINKKCVRALLNLSKLQIEIGNTDKALEYLMQIAAADPEMLPLAIKPVNKCFLDNQKEEKLALFQSWHQLNSSSEVVLEIAKLMEEIRSKKEAEEFLMRILKKNSQNIEIFSKVMSYKLDDLGIEEQEKLISLRDLLESQSYQRKRFICHKCGFMSSVLFWQCPSCHTWDKMKPNNKL